jgi:hypothetical protein
MELSWRRAQSVLDYLVAAGVDPWRLAAEGLGESLPLDPDETPRLASEGTPAEALLERIRENGVTRRPGVASILEMKKSGVDESVIQAMLNAPVNPSGASVREVHHTDVWVDECAVVDGIFFTAWLAWILSHGCH